jgi:hypothetical protein
VVETFTLIVVEDEDAHFRLMKRAVLKEFPTASIHHFSEALSCLEAIGPLVPDLIMWITLCQG